MCEPAAGVTRTRTASNGVAVVDVADVVWVCKVHGRRRSDPVERIGRWKLIVTRPSRGIDTLATVPVSRS